MNLYVELVVQIRKFSIDYEAHAQLTSCKMS